MANGNKGADGDISGGGDVLRVMLQLIHIISSSQLHCNLYGQLCNYRARQVKQIPCETRAEKSSSLPQRRDPLTVLTVNKTSTTKQKLTAINILQVETRQERQELLLLNLKLM